jgi:YD repeat-containing protein
MASLAHAPLLVQFFNKQIRPAIHVDGDNENLVRALWELPLEWAITPVLNKRAYLPGWQNNPIIDRGNLAHQLLNGTAIIAPDGREYTQNWNGFGTLTGERSDGIVGLDLDGIAALEEAVQLSSGDLPITVSWASGRPYRLGAFYQVSPGTQARIKAAGGWSGRLFLLGNNDSLHIRYDGWQQTIPPSVHPETGQYYWLSSPTDVETAPAPKWLDELILSSLAGSAGATISAPTELTRTTPNSWPLLPPIRINEPGTTNHCLRQLANWGYNKLNLTTPENLGNYITENAPKLPGWKEFVSSESKKDLGKNWGYRWAKSACKYWSSPRAQYRQTGPDMEWQNWLHEDSIRRLQWCIDQATKKGQIFSSQNQLITTFIGWSKEQFGIGFSKSTVLKLRSFWSELVGEGYPSGVQNVPNSPILYQQENQGFEGGTGLQSQSPVSGLSLADMGKQAYRGRQESLGNGLEGGAV